MDNVSVSIYTEGRVGLGYVSVGGLGLGLGYVSVSIYTVWG